MWRRATFALFILFLIFFFSCAGSKPGTGEIEYINIEEEINLGNEISQACNAGLKLYQNDLVENYMTSIAKEIGQYSDWPGDSFNVYIVDTTDINHFSLPGGHIYLYRGLFDSTTTLEETALIIAHEIAHIGNRDAIDRISKEYTFAFSAQSIFGYNPEITRRIISTMFTEKSILNYSHKKELSADKKAVEYAANANYNPNGLLAYLDKVETAEIEKPSLVFLLEKTHPQASKRLKTVRSAISKLKKNTELPRNRQEPEYARVLEILLEK